ncbi:CBS domain-containing protein CBSCBSPB5 [Glycine soja]
MAPMTMENRGYYYSLTYYLFQQKNESLTCTPPIGSIPSPTLFSSSSLSFPPPSCSPAGNIHGRRHPAPPPIPLHLPNSINLFSFGAVSSFWFGCTCSDIGAVERGKMASQSGASRRSISVVDEESLGIRGASKINFVFPTFALTIPETTTVYEACHRMVARRGDALLLTDSNALLCGILTPKDIAARVIAKEINLEETPVSKVMTRNPVFVLSETLAAEALQKMVQGLLRKDKQLQQLLKELKNTGEHQTPIHHSLSLFGSKYLSCHCLRSFLRIQSRLVTVSPTDSILTTRKKMVEFRASCAVVTVNDKPLGIFISKDILLRVIAQNLSPESTPVEKVMTPNSVCVVIDTPIVDALHTMHDGKFLHLPAVDRDGSVVAVVDVIHVTHAAVATVNQVGNNEAATTLMLRFWYSAMALTPNDDDDDTRSLDTWSMTEVITSVLQRLGDDIDPNNIPQILESWPYLPLYEDEDHDKVVLASDSDLAPAVDHARTADLKGIEIAFRLGGIVKGSRSGSYAYSDAWASAYSAALVAGLGILTYFNFVHLYIRGKG